MAPSVKTIIFFAALIAVVVLGTKTKINMGIWALFATFCLGILVCGMTTSAVISLFPTSIVFNILVATAFYGFATKNGTMEGIAQRIFYRFHKVSWFIPLLFFVTAYVLALLNCGDAVPIFLSPIAFGMALRMGYSPILAPLAIWAGNAAGSWNLWGPTNAMMSSYYAIAFGSEVATEGFTKMFFLLTGLMVLTMVITYLVLGGWRGKGTMEVTKPIPFTKEQKTTLTVILVMAALILIPVLFETFIPNPVTAWMKTNLTIQVLAVTGMLLLTVLKIGNLNEIIARQVPWNLIVMLMGMGMLINVSQNMGLVETLSGVLTSGAVPERLVVPAVFLICGILSFFVSGAVVTPLMMPIAPLLAVGSIHPTAVLLAMQIGLVSSSLSPVSQGGAVSISGCPDELRGKMTTQQMALGIINMIFWAVLAFLGIFNI